MRATDGLVFFCTVGILLGGGFLFLDSVDGVAPWKECLETRRIAEVGRCDQKGTCRVRYDNGEYELRTLPEVGMDVCVKWGRK